MAEHQTEKRFHNLTLNQVQALDKVLTEVIPIYGRGNFPTLQVRAKDIIRLVKERLVERDIQVKDIRLNGATASHVLVQDNGLGYKDLDIIFGVELPRQEHFQVIKEVVLGSLRDLLPCGVNRRRITFLTMKEAYVQKMVKVFTEHDRWSFIALSNNRAKTLGLRFVSSLRRQFEFSVDSFQIILDRMLESYWEAERNQEGMLAMNTEPLSNQDNREENKCQNQSITIPQDVNEDVEKDSVVATSRDILCKEADTVAETELPHPEAVNRKEMHEQELNTDNSNVQCQDEKVLDDMPHVHSEEDILFEVREQTRKGKEEFHIDFSLTSTSQPLFAEDREPDEYLTLQSPEGEELTESQTSGPPSVLHIETSVPKETVQCDEVTKVIINPAICMAENISSPQASDLEFSFPPPAKKTCSASQDAVPDYCPSPKLQRKMSRKLISKPPLSEKWSSLTDVSDITTQLFPPIEIPKPLQPKPPGSDSPQVHHSNQTDSMLENLQDFNSLVRTHDSPVVAPQNAETSNEAVQEAVRPKHSKTPPISEIQTASSAERITVEPTFDGNPPEPADPVPSNAGSDSWGAAAGKVGITVEAECMYGDFDQAMDHLRHRLIATHNPEEIRGGGLLKYSDLLVRNFRAASEMEIKSLERYMCSRFFIDFPDVSEQQRKIEAYLQCHFIGSEETSKYDYLMTLRRVIDESTVCLMGHEKRQTLYMITVLALRVLGEQNAIPNTANVTCFYQPAPYVTEPIYSSYFITQPQPPLVYHPYPLHVHMQSGLV